MKCVVGLLFFAVCAFEMLSASPVRNGMVFYQSQPDYYNAHRAFVMQYASQPIKSYRRRNGQAAGVSAYASGKKIAAKTYLKQAELLEDGQQLDGASHSVAEAYPEEAANDYAPNDDEQTAVANFPVANDVPEDSEDTPEDVPVQFVPDNNKKTPALADEEDDDEDEAPVRSRKTPSAGATYFPVTFGSTNGGAIAIANSYSTGKGGSASSRATAYGSPAKSKKRPSQQ